MLETLLQIINLHFTEGTATYKEHIKSNPITYRGAFSYQIVKHSISATMTLMIMNSLDFFF